MFIVFVQQWRDQCLSIYRNSIPVMLVHTAG